MFRYYLVAEFILKLLIIPRSQNAKFTGGLRTIAAPFGRFLPAAARIEHSIFRALHGRQPTNDMRISRSLRNYKFEFVIIYFSKKSKKLTIEAAVWSALD